MVNNYVDSIVIIVIDSWLVLLFMSREDTANPVVDVIIK